MWPYYLLIFIPLLFEFLELIIQSNYGSFSKKKSSNFSIALFFFIWGVMLACRSTYCGRDLGNYKYFFDIVSGLSLEDVFFLSPIEKLYYVFNWVVAQIYPDFRLFIVITSVLCTCITGWFYKRESSYAPLTILLFATNACFSMFYSGLRQSLAMLFIVPAYYFTKEKKLIFFILTVLVALNLHSSSIIIFILYPIFHMQIKNKDFPFVILLITIFFIFKVPLFYILTPLLHYRHSGLHVIETGGYAMYVFFLLCLVYSFLVLDEKKTTIEIYGLRNILLLATLIQCFAPIHPLAMRLNYYYIMLIPIAIPKLLNAPKIGDENAVQYSKWILVSFLTFFFFYNAYANIGIKRIYPYIAFWE